MPCATRLSPEGVEPGRSRDRSLCEPPADLESGNRLLASEPLLGGERIQNPGSQGSTLGWTDRGDDGRPVIIEKSKFVRATPGENTEKPATNVVGTGSDWGTQEASDKLPETCVNTEPSY